MRMGELSSIRSVRRALREAAGGQPLLSCGGRRLFTNIFRLQRLPVGEIELGFGIALRRDFYAEFGIGP